MVVVTVVYPTGPDDRAALESLRDQLRAERERRGLTYESAGALIGRSINFLYEMENLRSSLKLSSVQLWASIYDMRVEFGLADYWNFTWAHDELHVLYQLSRPFDAANYQRLWLVCALQAWRERLGIHAAEVAYWMNLKDAHSVTEWERKSNDPMLLRVMAQARLTKTSVTMKLWKREDWTFS